MLWDTVCRNRCNSLHWYGASGYLAASMAGGKGNGIVIAHDAGMHIVTQVDTYVLI